MSGTVAAVLKKVAVTLATNKKAIKTVIGIVLGALFIVLLPVIAVLGIFSGGLDFDTDSVLQTVEEQQTAGAATMTEIEGKMREEGYTEEQIEKAQILCSFALYPYVQESSFTEKLLGCFAHDQTDEELIANVNAVFSTAILEEEFGFVLQEMHETAEKK